MPPQKLKKSNWISNKEPMKVAEVFANVKPTVDADLLLKQTFQTVDTSMRLLPNHPNVRKTFLRLLVGMLLHKNWIAGQHFEPVEVPAHFREVPEPFQNNRAA